MSGQTIAIGVLSRRMRTRFWRPATCILFLLSACGAPSPEPTVQTMHSAVAKPVDVNQAKVARRQAELPPASQATGRIVFVKAGSIWMMDADGDNHEQLTVRSLDSADEFPKVSPDGSLLAYSSAKEGDNKIYLQSMEDMIPDPITQGPDRQPAFSPDGSKIAFMHGDPRTQQDLYIVDTKGETEARLLVEGDDDFPAQGGAPVWSADGSTIYYAADRREHQGIGIWSVNVLSGEPKRISHSSGKSDWVVDKTPALSPDGKTLIFASNRHANSRDHAGDFDVYTIDLASGALQRLTDDPGTVATPVYSQDGLRLYFASTRIRESEFEWEIYAMAAAGGKQRRLTRDKHPENYAPFVTISD